MPLASYASGTLSGEAIGVEQTLTALPGGATYICVVDLTNMAAGDSVTLTIYDKVIGTAGNTIAYQAVFTDVQSPETEAVSVPIPVTHGGSFTLNQTSGVARNYNWEVRSL